MRGGGTIIWYLRVLEFFMAKQHYQSGIRRVYQFGKLEQVMKEIIKYKIDILGLWEMRWNDRRKVKKEGTTVICSRNWNYHILRVYIWLSTHVAKALIGWKPSTNIITARFQTRHSKVTITEAHAPTMEEDDNNKDHFYKILQNTVNSSTWYQALDGKLQCAMSPISLRKGI